MRDNVAVAAELAGRRRAAARAGAERAARPARASAIRHGRFPATLSGGERQRSPSLARSSTGPPSSSPTSRPARSTGATASCAGPARGPQPARPDDPPRDPRRAACAGAGPSDRPPRRRLDRRRPPRPDWPRDGRCRGSRRWPTSAPPAPGGRHRGRPAAGGRRGDARARASWSSRRRRSTTAFAAANGAHLVVDYDGSRCRRRRRRDGHGRAASPRPPDRGRSARPTSPGPRGQAGELRRRRLVVRAARRRTTSVDRDDGSAGRWWKHRARSSSPRTPPRSHRGVSVGDSDRPARDQPGRDKGVQPAPAAAGAPWSAGDPARARRPPCSGGRVTVVGIAASVSTPDVAGLAEPRRPRWRSCRAGPAPRRCSTGSTPSATAADLAAAVGADHGRPPGRAVRRERRPTSPKASVDRTAHLFVPILLAFSVFALLAAAFIDRQCRQRHRPVELPRHRRHEGGRVHARSRCTAILLAQILVPVTIGAVARGGRSGRSSASRSCRRPPGRSGCPPRLPVCAAVVAPVLAGAFATAILAADRPGHPGRAA